MTVRTDSITAIIADMKPRMYTVKEAAERTNRSIDTLVRWRKNGVYVPKNKRKFGELTVFLYTDEDLKNLKKVAGLQRPGRKAHDAVPLQKTLRDKGLVSSRQTTAKPSSSKPARRARKKVVR